MKTIALILAVFALLPGVALASGFYMSPLAEAVFSCSSLLLAGHALRCWWLCW